MPLALRTFPDFPVVTGSVKAGRRLDEFAAGATVSPGAAAGPGAAEPGAAGAPPAAALPYSGSRNPATDFRNWAESAASFAIDVDVAVDPSAVCEEISRTTCMFFEIFPDATAC